MKFEGIYTPAITPLAADGQIDHPAFAEALEYLIASKVHGIIIGGSTGEYYAHTAQERFDLAAKARDVINGRLPLIVGTGAIRTEDSVAYAKAAKEIKADALLVGSPPYALPTQQEIADHMGLKAKSAAHRAIDALIEAGYLIRAGRGRLCLTIPADAPQLAFIDRKVARVVKHTVVLDANGVSEPCVDGPAPSVAGADVPVLPYGATSTLGEYTCTSTTDGVTCTDANGVGFRLARASLTRLP